MHPVLSTAPARPRRASAPSAARLGGATLAATLVLAGATVVAPGAAWAADPFSPTSLYGTTSGSRTIQEIDPTTGTAAPTTLAVPVVGANPGNVNQIGLSVDGQVLMLTDGTTVHRYTASTEEWVSVARSTGPDVANTMGGVDAKSGDLFFGGQASGSTFTFARYDASTNTIAPDSVSVTAPGAPGANGDLVFDGQGNMYFVAGAGDATTGGQVYRADAADIATGTATATPVGGAISAGGVNSIAFGSDGYLYLYGGGTFFQINPTTGATVGSQAFATQLTDLGSRALPFTARLTTELPDGRYDDGDDFTVELGTDGDPIGSPEGTDGRDSAVVGPILILPGQTYTIDQRPTPGTNPDDYTTTWTCLDASTGSLVTSGTGSSGSFVVPVGVTDVTCSFENVAKEATSAADDEKLDNAQGQPVTVPVLGNDAGVDLDPASVRIVGAEGDLVTELVVEGQGTWTVDPADGSITFTPATGFSGNPTPITYQVSDDRGNTAQADVLVTYVPVASADESLDNVQGQPVTVDVLGNDLGDLDPTTVRVVGAEGELVTELVVDGEGTWTVDPVDGSITFTPAAGFTGNPTPITYQVSDVRGLITEALVTVTYLVPTVPATPGSPVTPATPVTPAAPIVPATPQAPAVAAAPASTPAPTVAAEGLASTGSAVVWIVAAGLAASVAGASLLLLRRRSTQG